MAIGRKKRNLLHVVQKDLHLDDESYHRILGAIAGVGSAAELDREGFGKVMKRFEEMGFRGLLPSPYRAIPRGRLIPSESPQGLEAITPNQQGFISYLVERLAWDEGHYQAFCRRIIKVPLPLTKRDGQKIIIGLMAILRRKALDEKKKAGTKGDHHENLSEKGTDRRFAHPFSRSE